MEGGEGERPAAGSWPVEAVTTSRCCRGLDMRRWGDDGITEPGTEQGKEFGREFWERGGAGDSRPSGVGEAVAGRTTGSVEKPDTGAVAACPTTRAAGGDSSRGMATMRGGGLQEFRVELQTLP
mmetsp:Transcript_9531/g.22602  ORF Transcript_9531/g.22602 Transcript_9531/m.22602 type:complete len:124 (-) Transcript_9531:4014-4385(-)